MSGLLNQTGAVSGILGTTVGTSTSTPAVFYGTGSTDSPSSELGLSSGVQSSALQFKNTGIDTDSFWDNTNHRYLPTTAGYYYYSSAIRFKLDTTLYMSKIQIYMYKNGTLENIILHSWKLDGTKHTSKIAGPSGIVSMNGSSDYMELRIMISGDAGDASDQTLASGLQSYFNIFFLRSN